MTDIACPPIKDTLIEKSISTVALISRWSGYISNTRFDNGEGSREYADPSRAFPTDNRNLPADINSRRAAVLHKYIATIENFMKHGKTVVLVYPIPAIGWNVPDYMARSNLLGLAPERPLSTSFEVHLERNQFARDKFDDIPHSGKLIRADRSKLFCNTFEKGRSSAELNGRFLYSDDDHLNTTGAAILMDTIGAEFMNRREN